MNDMIRSTQLAGFAAARLVDVPELGSTVAPHTEVFTFDSRRVTIAPTVVSLPAVSPTTP